MLGQRFEACSSVEANPPPRQPCLAFVGLESLLCTASNTKVGVNQLLQFTSLIAQQLK
jgi:hypothetical protein